MFKILLLDNYDSFTYNLQHLIKSTFTGIVEVKRDSDINLDNILEYDSIVISPGPGNPETTPIAMEIIRRCYNKRPILGICLGLQCINSFFNGETVKAPYPIHGKRSSLGHIEDEIYKDIPQGINIARYHSLMIVPGEDIVETGWSDDGVIMSIKHKSYPIYGLQFHPESFLSDYGVELINNFLITVGLNE